jgi:hypothetical protein
MNVWKICIETVNQLWWHEAPITPCWQYILAVLREEMSDDNNLHESIELVQYLMVYHSIGFVGTTNKEFVAKIAGTCVGTVEIRRVTRETL